MAVLCEKLPVPADFSMEERLFVPRPLPDAAARLRHLADAIRDDLRVLDYPSAPLPYRHNTDVLEVAVIGGGQAGRSLAFGLSRYGCRQVKVFDRNPRGLQGPWRTYGRNHLLRTRKESTGGLDWGFPNLHFQRWSDAKFGPDYHRRIVRIPRLVWADYLDWYAEVLDLPIEYDCEVTDISWRAEDRHFVIATSRGEVSAQFVVLGTGIESAGRYRIPPEVSEALPRSVYAHTMQEIEMRRLEGRDVVVLGGGASAFDAANAALLAGARSVDLMIRRERLPPVHRVCWGSKWYGYHRHYIELPDEMKWSYSLGDLDLGVPPPRDTYYEAVRDRRFQIHGSAGIDRLDYRDGRIIGVYGGSKFRHDFMICGTGCWNRIDEQDELRSVVAHVALWKDVFVPPDGRSHPELENSPYLGASLEFTPKRPEDDFVRRVYYLCSGVAHLSGYRCNLSGLQFAAQRVCHDISRQLFLQHRDAVKHAFDTFELWE